MNILYLANHLNIGGITSYLLSLSCGMKQRGHNVYIASYGGKLLPAFIERGITYIPIPIKTKKEISHKILLSMFKLSKAIDTNNIDILHSNSRTTQVLAALLNKFKGAPYVSTCHGFFKKRFLRRIFPCWGQKAIAISEPVKVHLIRDFKLDENNIVVIHNGIDVDRFSAQPAAHSAQRKKKFGLSEGPVIGIVARLSDVKGHKYLIEAMKLVLEEQPYAQLLIAGDGKMKKELVSLTKSLCIERSVFFIPEAQDTKDVLSAMDLFVAPSLEEGLGLSLMEAMAFGLPVIGSYVGGIKSLIQDGYSGLLVRPKAAKQLSESILELLKDEAKRKYLGQNGKNFICQEFSLEKMVKKTEEVYLECLSEKL